MIVEVLDIDVVLLELLYDVEEGFLGFDCILFLKVVLGELFWVVGDCFMWVIFVCYSFVFWLVEVYFLYKCVDVIVVVFEVL